MPAAIPVLTGRGDQRHNQVNLGAFLRAALRDLFGYKGREMTPQGLHRQRNELIRENRELRAALTEAQNHIKNVSVLDATTGFSCSMMDRIDQALGGSSG